MKQWMMIGAIFAALSGQGQSLHFDNQAIQPVYQLGIAWQKTTLLIFPAAVQSADRGARYVLAEKIPGVENMLKVKAGEKNFSCSNLHVITKDGRVYTFDVSYTDTLLYQTIDLRQQPGCPAAARFSGISLNSADLQQDANAIVSSKPFLHGVHSHKAGMEFTLDGIYLKNDVIFLRYWLKNQTAIAYDIGSMRFFIRDKKQAKRTAVQDNEVQPVYIRHDRTPEHPDGEVIVAAFPKFTIAENKYFVTELTEAGGDRNPALRLTQHKLLHARALPHN